MYLQITGEVSKKSLCAQPFKQNKTKKRESSQMRLKVFYVVIYCLVMCDVFTNNRRSLQIIPQHAALQNKTKNKKNKKKKSESSQKRLKDFYVVIYCLVLYYIFTSNRRSLQKTNICAALQK